MRRCCGPCAVIVAFASVPIQPVTKCHAVMAPECTVQGGAWAWGPATNMLHLSRYVVSVKQREAGPVCLLC